MCDFRTMCADEADHLIGLSVKHPDLLVVRRFGLGCSTLTWAPLSGLEGEIELLLYLVMWLTREQGYPTLCFWCSYAHTDA
jgi:hypothetical protein